MGDRSLVLRYLSFYERTHHKAKQGLKRFIQDFLKDHQNARKEKLDEYSRVFRKSMRAAITIFGGKGFRLRRDMAKGGSEWAAKPNATIFQIVATSFAPSGENHTEESAAGSGWNAGSPARSAETGFYLSDLIH